MSLQMALNVLENSGDTAPTVLQKNTGILSILHTATNR